MYIYIYIYIYIRIFFHTSSSSSSRATSTVIPVPLSPLLPIVRHFWQVLRVTSRILTELLYICPSWSPCFCSAYRSAALMSSSLLLQQCSPCLFHLTLIVFVMGGILPYSCCFVECCLQDLFNIARSIFV